jgi:hypothetical protein
MKFSIRQRTTRERRAGFDQDVKRGNEKECVSLLRAVIPELPHSSQWQEGNPVTPENAAAIPPGTAIATFEDGHYGNAPHGNHAAIFLGPDIDEEGRVRGIQVIDQSSGWQAREHTLPFGEPASGHGYYADQFSVIRR